MSLPITTSPDISLLDFNILYDISGAIPAITLTNASVGVPSGTTRLNLCTWWYVITTPSGTAIHQGSVTSPDVTTANWTTLSIAPFSWPTPFGNPPCGQIEFSCSNPYICTLYVKDGSGNIFSLAKNTTICRPNGNTSNTCGSFGTSIMNVQVQCNNGQIYASDTTNYTYQTTLTPSVKTNIWTLTYPQDDNGNQPANVVAENSAYVYFDIGYNSAGYRLYVRNYATYAMGDGVTIKIQYKSTDDFAVLCSIDLCKLSCQIQKFYELSKKQCGKLDDPTLNAKMTQINLLMSQALTGIMQPLCGIDVAAIVAEIQGIGDFDPDCDCGCSGAGVNLSNPTGGRTGGGCCPVCTDVVDVETDNPPTACPGSYFPVNVKDPTGVTTIGVASNINDLVSLLNAYPAWQAYGTAFASGNCKVCWIVATGATPVDVPVELTSVAPLGPCLVTGNIVIVNTSNPPVGCPSGNPYPKSVYNPLGTVIIGVANSINDVVSILNTNSLWQAYGTASVQDNCHVQWNLSDCAVAPPSVPVSGIITACTGGEQYYTINTKDICTGAATSPYPANIYVDFGSGAVAAGYVATQAAMIVALNAVSTKPATVTFSADTGSIGVTVVRNSDCTLFSTVINIYTDAAEKNFMLMAPNHGFMTTTPSLGQGQTGLGLANNTVIGKIPTAEISWHDIRIGNYVVATDANTGGVLFFDVTNPLMPIFVKRVQLTSLTSIVFNGTPNSATVASGGVAVGSWYGLYFPTDYQAMTLSSIYVVQSVGGGIWKIDFYAAPGTEVVDGFQHAKLLGKCPRAIINNQIWFTQDGDLEQAASLSSTIPEGSVINLDLATFSSAGISTRSFFADEYIWGATYDGLNTLYYVGNEGTLITVNLTTLAANLFRHVLFTLAEFRLNAKYYSGKIYVSSLKFDAGIVNTGTIIVDAGTRAVTPFQSFNASSSLVPTSSHYNFQPLGQCVGVLTYDGYQNVSHKGGGVSLFKLDGTHLGDIPIDVGNLYNVIPFTGVSIYTPTSYTP